MGKTSKIRRSRAQWQRIIARQEASGQSQKAFCRDNAIALSTFVRWRQILQHEAVAKVPTTDNAGAALFAELTMAAGSSGGTASPWEVELELGAGAVLRIRRVVPC